MLKVGYVLVLIYSPFQIAIEPRGTIEDCQTETTKIIGKSMEVTFWDNMNGSNPIPKVVAAFCAVGSTDLN